MADEDKIHVGKYYELTDEDIACITNAFNNKDLDDLIGFCKALAMVGSFRAWDWAKAYASEHGVAKLCSSCDNCGKKTVCDADYALNVCGPMDSAWIPQMII